MNGRLLSGIVIALHFLLLILIYFFYTYFCRKCRTVPQPPSSNSTPAAAPAPALHLHLVNSIPVTNFKSIIGAIDKPQCAVCLLEFMDGDKLRVLPQCSHRFHLDCLDTWFRFHANCPLCRALVDDKPAAGSESMV